jgi:hypothetical protein
MRSLVSLSPINAIMPVYVYETIPQSDAHVPHTFEYLGAGVTGEAKIAISDLTGRAVCETVISAKAGLHRVQWTLVAPLLNNAPAGGARGASTAAAGTAPAAAPVAATSTANCAGGGGASAGGRGGPATAAAPGSYLVTLTVGGASYTKSVQVLEDRWMNER